MKKLFYNMPRAARFIFIPLVAAAFLSLVSFIVMQLWNNLLPDILSVKAITFWQAAGIFILCKLLFGFGRMGGFRQNRADFKERMAERLKTMSPEERECFKKKFGGRMINRCEQPNKDDETTTLTS